MSTTIVIFIRWAFAALAFASGATPAQKSDDSGALESIKSVVSRYGDTTGVELEVEKTVELVLLGETTKSKGKIFLAKGKLRIELGEPDNSLIVMNDKEIWIVTPTPKELGGKLQVSKIASREMQKQARAPLALLLSKKTAWDQLEIKKDKRNGELREILLTPKNKKNYPDLAQVKVVISESNNELRELVIFDDIENETKFAIQDSKFDRKISSSKFRYDPPRDAEVTIYE